MLSLASTCMSVIVVSLLNVEGASYEVKHQTLPGFPHDIPLDVTTIVVDDADLAYVDYIEQFPNLTTLSLQLNRLLEFPDLENVSSTLQNLHLSSNQITVIPAEILDKLTALKSFACGKNPITVFPDVAGPSLTLIELFIGDTSLDGVPVLPLLGASVQSLKLNEIAGISHISKDDLKWFPNLRKLVVSGSSLSRIDDLCTVPLGPVFELNIQNVLLECSPTAAKLKFAVDSGHVDLIGPVLPSCQDEAGTIIQWGDIYNSTLQSPGGKGFQEMVYEAAPTFYCIPRTISSHTPATVVQCAFYCLTEPRCMAFNANGTLCHLASNNPAEPGDPTASGVWYTRL